MFLTVDPLVSLTDQPYGYVGQDPTNAADLDGLCYPGTCWAVHSAQWIDKHAVRPAVKFVKHHGVQITIGAGILVGSAVVIVVAPEAAPLLETALIRLAATRAGASIIGASAVAARGYQEAGKYTNPGMKTVVSRVIQTGGAIRAVVNEYAPSAKLAFLHFLEKYGPK